MKDMWLIFLFVLMAAHASPASASNVQISPKVPSCSALLQLGESPRSGVSVHAKGLLALVNIGFQQMATETEDLLYGLTPAVGSAHPLNPFVGATSNLGLALAHRADGYLEQLSDADWSWFQSRVKVLMEGKLLESEKRQENVVKTASLNAVRFVTYEELLQALQSGWVLDQFSITAITYLGSTQKLQLLWVLLRQSLDVKVEGLVAISEFSDGSAPNIKWVIRYPGEKSADEKSRIAREKIWVLDGKVFAARTDDRMQTEILVQIDPRTGGVIRKFEVPEGGRSQIWNLRSGQIIAVKWGGWMSFMGRAKATQFYRFDPTLEEFVKTGLDIGPLKARALDDVVKGPGWFLAINGEGNIYPLFQKILTDGQNIFFPTAQTAARWAAGRSDHGLVHWSDTQRVGAKFFRYDKGGLVGLKLDISDEYHKSRNAKFKTDRSADSMGRTLEFPTVFWKDDLDLLKAEILVLPGTTINVVYVVAPGLADMVWLVDRTTLKATTIESPKDLVRLRQMGGVERRINTKSGEQLLTWSDWEGRVQYIWVLNPSTLKFDGPDVFQLPESGSKGPHVFVPDSHAHIGQVTNHGIWVPHSIRVQREEAQ